MKLPLSFSIKTKFIAAFGIMACFTALSGISSVSHMNILVANSRNLLGNVLGIQPLSELARDPYALEVLAARGASVQTPADLQKISAGERQVEKAYAGHWEVYAPTIDPGAETVDAGGFGGAWAELTKTAAKIAGVEAAGKTAQVQPLLDLLRSEVAVFNGYMDADLQLQVDESRQLNANTDAVSSSASLDSMVVAVVAAGSSLIVAWWMLKLISEPIMAMTRVMRRIAIKDFDVQIAGVDRGDEIGAMARACEVFRVNGQALEKAHEALRTAEEQAQMLARHDALTGLPNRRVFTSTLQSTLAHSLRHGTVYSVLLIDLDGFKKVNDMLGHQLGDMVLCEVAGRLQRSVRKQDTVARLGGDEFAIIAPDNSDARAHIEAMKQLAERLLITLAEVFHCDGNVVDIGASIGIAPCRAGATDVSNVLHSADVAMYRAKQSGRGTFKVFEQGMDDELREQEMLERDLLRAIADESIGLNYQPLVSIETNRILGFEALARWNHPTRGAVPPDIFIPVAERLHLMPKLTAYVLRQACRDARHWPEYTRVAVNFSPSSFHDPELPTKILEVLSSEGLAPRRLEIEITENALLGDVEGIRAILTRLRMHGITISLDDFGTGYSSLNHLREFKFDKVKIDRSFVMAMADDGTGDGDSEKIIDAILGLTKSLGLPTVAEGIESAAILRRLRLKGCDFGQGYYLAHAVPADAALAMLRGVDACVAVA